MTRILLEMANLLLIYLIAFYCVLAFVTLMIRWVNFWVRWSYFVAYQTLFLITLRIFLPWWLRVIILNRFPFLNFPYSIVADRR
ncbi:MAG: hypothetical protein OJF51_002485 [Nitrospira sp.]|jgi:hypothetical protein|nr:MAG: hypothetical protein OJF51_002485 [Nitrospira sp.]